MSAETKEGAALPWPLDDVREPADPAAPRAALIAEWERVNPQTPAEIAQFYASSTRMAADLEAWHALPARQSVTAMVVHVAQQAGAQYILDVGCGAGHDLRALRAALPHALLGGVEPHRDLRYHVAVTAEASCYGRLVEAWSAVADADLILCIDVLEHLPDPESFLAEIAARAPVGCLLFEMTATFDTGTPLHLPRNRGWHPGRCLESHGWEIVDRAGASDRVRIWRRTALEGRQRAGLLLCAYRAVNAETMSDIMDLCLTHARAWRLKCKTGDGMISRSRGILVTDWWRATNDDVALFVDDDVQFDAADALRLVERCRAGHDIIVGAYPVHDGGHLALRTLPGTEELHFTADAEPVEIEYGATGFMAIHRRVIDALVRTCPLMHANQPWSYHNLFPFLEIENPVTGCREVLSEDWSLCHLARQAGFTVWLDPSVRLQHASVIPVSVANMATVHDAIAQA